MEKKSFQAKSLVGLVMATIYLACVLLSCLTFFDVTNVRTKAYGANSVIAYGHVTDGVTNLRFRSSMDTSNTSNVITKVNGGKTMDIYGTESDSSNYEWLYVAMNINNSYTYGYIAAEYVTIDSYVENSTQTTDESFEDYLTRQGFPESYKSALRQLHAKYPNWVFIADKTGVDWNTLLANENVKGRSLIYSSAASSWKSTAEGCYDWNTGTYVELDSGGWVQASPDLVAYALDPRNFLTSSYIFMFEKLSYNSVLQTSSGLSSIISGTFMENSSHDLSFEGVSYNYNDALFLAARRSGVSPYHLASRIIQEQGTQGTGSSISGNVSGYGGLYNYYNQGAYKTSSASAVVNGLIYANRSDSASLRPWNSRMKSIVGGAIILGKNYINKGQDTIYYEKFDVTNFYHQYMTNILGARSEAVTASKAYTETMKQNTSLVFEIPVYENMPESICDCPVGSGSVNNKLSSLSVSGQSLTPSFNKDTTSYSVIVPNNVASVDISAQAIDSGAAVSGTGTVSLSEGENNFTINVRAQNGSVRSYYIKIVRESSQSSGSIGDTSYNTSLSISNSRVSGIGIGSDVGSVLENVSITGGYGKICDKNGNEKTGRVATGDKLNIYDNNGNIKTSLCVVIYGDINGDGVVDLLDIVRLKKYIVGSISLDSEYLEAADANRNGSSDILDIVAIKKHITGSKYIVE